MTNDDYDFIIRCSEDFTPNIDVERQASTTGDYEDYASIGSVTLHLAATYGGSAIHATLSVSGNERSGKPGRVYGTFDTADMTTHLLPYKGRKVYLVLTKSGEFVKSFECLVLP